MSLVPGSSGARYVVIALFAEKGPLRFRETRPIGEREDGLRGKQFRAFGRQPRGHDGTISSVMTSQRQTKAGLIDKLARPRVPR
jgi:hypothetical protein